MLNKIFLIFEFFEKFQIRTIQNYLKSKDIKIIFDIGAHEGIFFENFDKKKNFNKIFCFEPQLKYSKFLKEKFKNNNKYEIINCAIDVNEEKKLIKINAEESTSTMSKIDTESLTYKIKNFVLNKSDSYLQDQEVTTIRLDNFILKNNVNEISLLYMDTEGYQLNILKSLGDHIYKVKYILFRDKILHPFKEYNFKILNEYLISKNFVLTKKFYHLGLTSTQKLYLNDNFK